MEKSVFRSGIDWWVWVSLLILPVLLWVTAIDNPWWYAVFVCGGMTVLCLVELLGCRYEIDGDDLAVYMFFHSTRFPISKIKSVRKVKGVLAAAALSTWRVSIVFTNRSVLKSYAPLEISPVDRDAFIDKLKSVNPSIEISE